MCGIVGYIGPRVAPPLLLEGLKRLEYRGYDSAGVAVLNGNGVEMRKAPGKITELEAVMARDPVYGTAGIAHTRWATHGAPNWCNAHPHIDCDGSIALVHNGIVENGSTLRQALEDVAHTRQVIYLDDGDLAVLERTGFRIIDMNAAPMARTVSSIDWDLDMIERGGFAHFMLKEIFEQPSTIENTMRGRLLVDDGTARLGGLNLTNEQLLEFDNIVITACGTSWHSALIGEFMIEELARIPVEVEYASEFRYRNPIITEKTLCIAISQ